MLSQIFEKEVSSFLRLPFHKCESDRENMAVSILGHG
jgi:hypothetical protein